MFSRLILQASPQLGLIYLIFASSFSNHLESKTCSRATASSCEWTVIGKLKAIMCQGDSNSNSLKWESQVTLEGGLSVPRCRTVCLWAQGYLQSSASWASPHAEREDYISIQVFHGPRVLQQRKIICTR